MAEAVFGAADRVDGNGGGTKLPPELQGKSAEEIAAYYQNREVRLANAAYDKGKKDAAPAPVHQVEVPDKEPTSQDVWNDPVNTIKRIVASEKKDSVSAEEFRGVTAAALPALEQAARIALREKYKNARVTFAELEPELEQFLTQSGIQPAGRINPAIWEAAYDAVRGKKLDSYIQTAETRAKQPPAERVTPVGGPAPAERELTSDEKRVIHGLGRSPERYRKATGAMESGGTLPYTVDNR